MHNRFGHRFQRRLDVPVWLEPKGVPSTYADKVLGYNPIRLWPLWDAVGSASAEELVVGDDGTPSAGVTFGQDGIDDQTSALFDGVNDYVDVFSPALNATFNGLEGTMVLPARVSGGGVWTDGSQRKVMQIRVDISNYAIIERRVANNELRFQYAAGAVYKQVDLAGLNTTDWMYLAITWSRSADEMIAYFNGVQTGAIQNGLGLWAGALNAAFCAIGSAGTGPGQRWDGYDQYAALFDVPLPASAIADLAVV